MQEALFLRIELFGYCPFRQVRHNAETDFFLERSLCTGCG